jgi:outer membrane protein assembly factor BamD (BamD/ComL family)
MAALNLAVLAQEAAPPDPPEEDETLSVQEYAFNPLQARKEMQVGNYYFKKGSYRAAAGRFLEAGKWDPNNAEAFLRAGESYEKLKDWKAMRAAYEKYLALAADGREATRVRKSLAAKR